MRRPIFFGLALGVVLGTCGWTFCRNLFRDEELASKVEWSIVQATEYQHRDKDRGKIEIVKMDNYSLVGIPVNDARKEIWVMLNSRNPPYYKQLPQGNFSLSKEDLKIITASGVVSSTVENSLESHVEDLK